MLYFARAGGVSGPPPRLARHKKSWKLKPLGCILIRIRGGSPGQGGVMNFRSSFWALATILLAVIYMRPIHAQVLYGSVVGLVQDASGSAVPGAQVSITNNATGQSHNAKTDEGGRF